MSLTPTYPQNHHYHHHYPQHPKNHTQTSFNSPNSSERQDTAKCPSSEPTPQRQSLHRSNAVHAAADVGRTAQRRRQVLETELLKIGFLLYGIQWGHIVRRRQFHTLAGELRVEITRVYITRHLRFERRWYLKPNQCLKRGKFREKSRQKTRRVRSPF